MLRERANPSTSLNDYLVHNGYGPVEKDASIHSCYLCLLYMNRLETILGDINGRRSAIVKAIVEAENAPGVTERTISNWIETAYKEVE